MEQHTQEPEGGTEQDGHLHLDGVEVGQLGARAMPRGVNAQGVGAAPSHGQAGGEGLRAERLVKRHGGTVLEGGIRGAGPAAGPKDGEGDGEELVVDHASVDGEDGHEQDDVAACRQSVCLYNSIGLSIMRRDT